MKTLFLLFVDNYCCCCCFCRVIVHFTKTNELEGQGQPLLNSLTRHDLHGSISLWLLFNCPLVAVQLLPIPFLYPSRTYVSSPPITDANYFDIPPARTGIVLTHWTWAKSPSFRSRHIFFRHYFTCVQDRQTASNSFQFQPQFLHHNIMRNDRHFFIPM